MGNINSRLPSPSIGQDDDDNNNNKDDDEIDPDVKKSKSMGNLASVIAFNNDNDSRRRRTNSSVSLENYSTVSSKKASLKAAKLAALNVGKEQFGLDDTASNLDIDEIIDAKFNNNNKKKSNDSKKKINCISQPSSPVSPVSSTSTKKNHTNRHSFGNFINENNNYKKSLSSPSSLTSFSKLRHHNENNNNSNSNNSSNRNSFTNNSQHSSFINKRHGRSSSLSQPSLNKRSLSPNHKVTTTSPYKIDNIHPSMRHFNPKPPILQKSKSFADGDFNNLHKHHHHHHHHHHHNNNDSDTPSNNNRRNSRSNSIRSPGSRSRSSSRNRTEPDLHNLDDKNIKSFISSDKSNSSLKIPLDFPTELKVTHSNNFITPSYTTENSSNSLKKKLIDNNMSLEERKKYLDHFPKNINTNDLNQDDSSNSSGSPMSGTNIHNTHKIILKKHKINIDDAIQRLLDAGYSSKKSKKICLKNFEIMQICYLAREIFISQPALLELSPPVKIAGDIHGQFGDLLRLFTKCGFPPSSNYLFLGDYVDRGQQSLETILLLLCYKIKYPENFFLLRGNHECANVTRVYGFYDECKRRCNVKIWKMFIDTFNSLPLASIVANKIFCVHGGLSPSLNSMDEIRQITRPTDVPDFGLINDLLWSDPIDSQNEWEDNERGVSFCYNKVSINNFLNKFGLDLICRAHMVVEDGYEFFNNRTLVTVFSAPNYCGEFNNWGAIMAVDEKLLCSFQLLDPLDSSSLKEAMKKGRKEREHSSEQQELEKERIIENELFI